MTKVLDEIEGEKRFVEVIELYAQSQNSFKRRKGHLNKGMAMCSFIDDVEDILSYE